MGELPITEGLRGQPLASLNYTLFSCISRTFEFTPPHIEWAPVAKHLVFYLFQMLTSMSVPPRRIIIRYNYFLAHLKKFK